MDKNVQIGLIGSVSAIGDYRLYQNPQENIIFDMKAKKEEISIKESFGTPYIIHKTMIPDFSGLSVRSKHHGIRKERFFARKRKKK